MIDFNQLQNGIAQYVSSFDLETSDLLALLGVIATVITLFIAYIWRVRDRKHQLTTEIEQHWNRAVEISYKLRMDCLTIKQKFEFSDISHLNMQSTVEDWDDAIFKKLHENAKASLSAFQTESAKFSIKELKQAKEMVLALNVQLAQDADNFNARMTLAYEQLDKRWSSMKSSC
ncbi:hypothetical protein VXS06_09535 [Photobacterium toruni]|uniref:Uncharacterized protein n=1 Tax=Photobacterium toruni TaxID=1935446 RepID=A0ABU6L604_9GAMM|nr:hypothetical protein [Photobacterium toruni]